MGNAATASSITNAFQQAKDQGRAALMPYLMAGFPDAETSLSVAAAYADAGADLVEVGVPYSDPLADGPVIHAAGTRALEAGATLQTALDVCASISDRVPAVPMVYSNMVLATGEERFASLLAEVGAAAAIVPDMPLEEAGPIRDALGEKGLAMVPLVAPTTPEERRQRICKSATGFVYVVSDRGVTGERGELPAGLSDLVGAVRKEASVPAAVGFGISSPEQAAAVGAIADGIIIGTRLVRAVDEASDADAAVAAVTDLLRQIRTALDRTGP